MSKPKSAEELQLLSSIETLLADGENQIALPLTAINQGIAQLSVQSAKTLTAIQGKLLKSIDAANVENDNAVDALGMAILQPLQDWQDENNLLLTQLAASSGLTQPGDPLEAALVSQIAEEPELAYSATLLLALRDALPYLGQIVEVLREIRDRMPDAPVGFSGESIANEQVDIIPAELPAIDIADDEQVEMAEPRADLLLDDDDME